MWDVKHLYCPPILLIATTMPPIRSSSGMSCCENSNIGIVRALIIGNRAVDVSGRLTTHWACEMLAELKPVQSPLAEELEDDTVRP